MSDSHKNFAYSTIASAPSPATSGTSAGVQTGDGLLFPAVPFNATVWPSGVTPLATNSEIVRVTNISTDTFTFVRGATSGAGLNGEPNNQNRSIVVGDQIAAGITAKTLTDAERLEVFNKGAGIISQNFPLLEATATATVSNTRVYGGLLPLVVGDVINNISVGVRTAGAGTTPTSIVLGLLDKTGKVLQQSANVNSSTDWTTANHIATAALGGAYTVLASDVYYACIWVSGTWGTTQMALLEGVANPIINAIGSGSLFSATTTNASFPSNGSSFSLSASGANASPYWFAVS